VDPNEGRSSWSERTAADLASLLVELSRALKGLRFYDQDHPAHRDVLDRAYLAWRVELDRTGPLELQFDGDGFRADGLREHVPTARLRELIEALEEHQVATLRVTPALTRQGLGAFLRGLAEEPRRLAPLGGVAAVVAAECAPGITLPGTGAAPAEVAGEDPNETTQPMAPPRNPVPAPPAAAPAPPPPAPEALSALDDAEPDLDALAGAAADVAPAPGASVASLGSALLAGDPLALDAVDLPESGDPVALAPLPEPAAPRAAEEPGLHGSPFEDFTKPTLEEDPLAAPPTSESDDSLRSSLQDLDGCTDDGDYADLATLVAAQAVRAFADGYWDATYRTILVLADHAVGMGGRSGRQALVAQERLENLCREERLTSVIDRACDPEGSIGIRGAQVLLQLGGRAVAALLDRLVVERDGGRAAQIRSIVIALGERAAPIVVAAIRGDDPRRARTAVRLAGELQSSHLVPTLEALLGGGAPELRRDALRALSHIGGARALAAVESALASDRPGVAETAAVCLGEMAQRTSVRPLMTRLDQAVEDGSVEMARAVVGALGSLGAEEAVPKLVALLERRTLWNRTLAKALRVPALEALSRLPGREAARAVERATAHRDARVRQAAQRIAARAPRKPAPRPGGEEGGSAG
jgi:hypothetical protein